MRGPRLRQAPGRDLTPRRLKSGKWIGCRHYVPSRKPPWVGFDPKKAKQAHDPTVAYTAHYHDFD